LKDTQGIRYRIRDEECEGQEQWQLTMELYELDGPLINDNGYGLPNFKDRSSLSLRTQFFIYVGYQVTDNQVGYCTVVLRSDLTFGGFGSM
jgi:hypothetical protein